MIFLDILRIVMAIFIFLRHLITMGGCVFGHLDDFICAQTNIVMIAFFIVSGFCINSSSKGFSTKKDVLYFYKDRLLKILPLYLSVEVIRFLIGVYCDGKGIEYVATLPIRLLGIQIHYSVEVFSGVSWFVSCLLVCYFVFPLVSILFDKLSCRKRVFLGIGILLILTYSQVICRWYSNIDMYYDPFFRSLEFVLGVLVSSLLMDINEHNKLIFRLGFSVLTFFLLFVYEKKVLSEGSCALGFITATMMIICAGWERVSTDSIPCKVVVKISSFTFELFVLQDILFSTPVYRLEDHLLRNGGNDEKRLFYIITMVVLIILSRCWGIFIKRLRAFHK